MKIYKEKNGKIFCGDHLKVLSKFPDNFVDLTITSPPYDKLRKYKGYSFDFGKLSRELYRITKNGGIVVWVIGDATISGSETGTSFRQALFFKKIGFNIHDTMIFRKRNPLPQVKRKRYMNEFEFMFIFSKGYPNICNYLMIPCETVGLKNIQTKNYSAGVQRKTVRLVEVNKEKIKGNVWEYSIGSAMTPDKFAFKHPSTFPERLAEDHILSWSNPGQVILDPMCGSGTVLKIAKKNKRKWIGIDSSEEYFRISKRRVQIV